MRHALNLIGAALALAACAPSRGEPLFAMSRTGPTFGETTAVDRGGTWWSTDRAGTEHVGRLPAPRFERLRAVLRAAELAVITRPCAPDTDHETVNVADHERGRYVSYVRPCLVPDPSTERALTCLTEALFSSNDRFAQTCGESPRP